jgi:hypothetical protein
MGGEIKKPNVQRLIILFGGTLIHADQRRFFFLNQRDQRFSASKNPGLKKSHTLSIKSIICAVAIW